MERALISLPLCQRVFALLWFPLQTGSEVKERSKEVFSRSCFLSLDCIFWGRKFTVSFYSFSHHTGMQIHTHTHQTNFPRPKHANTHRFSLHQSPTTRITSPFVCTVAYDKPSLA